MHTGWMSEDCLVGRGLQVWAVVWGVGLASAGALIAYVLVGGPGAGVGAVIGAVTGAFAPSVYDAVRARGIRKQAWRQSIEPSVPQSPARLLDPRLEVVRFSGRNDELARLVAWCEDTRAIPLRLITGPGGVGKTRLAVELTGRMTRAGWRCERIGDGQEGDAIGALRAVTTARVLLVIDYAETRVGLKRMLAALADHDSSTLRVLLLARSAGEWWDQLGVEEPRVWDLVQAARLAEIALSPVVDAGISDAEIIQQAIKSFAKELGLPEKEVVISEGNSGARSRMLDLHAAALVALLDEAPTETVQVDIGAVLTELLRHEQHFWYLGARMCGLSDGADGIPASMQRQIVAVNCLIGAASEAEARALPGRVPGLSPSARVAGWLRQLYPPSDNESDWIGSLQPDRLAELHTVQELVASAELAESCLSDLNARQARRAMTLLARASADDPGAEDLLSRALPNLAGFIEDLDAPTGTLAAIYNAIPYPTLMMSSAAVAVCRRIISLLPDDAQPVMRAAYSFHLGFRLLAVGHPADALDATKEAVTIYRTLTAADSDRYRPEFARSLSDLCQCFIELGQPANALPIGEEAIAVSRELAAINPDGYRSTLIAPLNNQSACLSTLGREADALAYGAEAVAISRELAATDPDKYCFLLAQSLNNYGTYLSGMGRYAEALSITAEAVAMRRKLVAAEPDKYRPNLAQSLSNLGLRFTELGRHAEALSVTEESVAIRRELAAVNPQRYRAALAESLSNLGSSFWKLGRPADDARVTRETVCILRDLAATNPERYRSDLAESLNNLAVSFSGLGRIVDALPLTQEAITILREEETTGPNLARLAAALINLGSCYSELKLSLKSLRATAEAVDIYRELAASNPRYRAELLASLTMLGGCFLAVGRRADANKASKEAFMLRKAMEEMKHRNNP